MFLRVGWSWFVTPGCVIDIVCDENTFSGSLWPPHPLEKKRAKNRKKPPSIYSPCLNFEWPEIPHNIYRIFFFFQTVQRAVHVNQSLFSHGPPLEVVIYNTDLFEWDTPALVCSIWIVLMIIVLTRNTIDLLITSWPARLKQQRPHMLACVTVSRVQGF